MNKLNKDRRKRITDDPGGQRWDREFQEAAPSDDEPALTIQIRLQVPDQVVQQRSERRAADPIISNADA